MSLTLLLLALSPRAGAVDVSGPAQLPAQEGGLWTWEPVLLDRLEGRAGIVVEGASTALSETVIEGDVREERVLVGPRAGLRAGGGLGLLSFRRGGLRLGLASYASVPVSWEFDADASGGGAGGVLEDAGGGAALGDARVDLALVAGGGGAIAWGLAAVPGVRFPSSGGSLLGMAGTHAQGRLAGQLGVGGWSLGLDAMRRTAAADAPFATAETGDSVRVSASLRRALGARAGVGLEATRWNTGGASVVEYLARADARLGEAWTLGVGAGSALQGGPGVAAARGTVRLTRTFGAPPPTKEIVPEPVAAVPAPPDTFLKVTDPTGAPLGAVVRVQARAGGPAPTSRVVDPNGELALALGPGPWRVFVEAPGRTTVAFDVDLPTGPTPPVRLEARLHPRIGDGEIAAHVVDGEGAALRDVTLDIDAATHARTSTGGDIRVGGLGVGEVQVVARAPGTLPATVVRVVPSTQPAPTAVTLAYPLGTIRVRARDGAGAPVDAQVLPLGIVPLPTVNLGEDGEALVQLLPGTWTLAASSPSHGEAEREVVVRDVEPRVHEVAFVYPAAGTGLGELCLRVVDPDGAPGVGLNLRLDGGAVGSTSSGGSACLSGVAEGTHRVEVLSPRLRPGPPLDVRVGPGTQEVIVPVSWRPGQVEIEVRDGAGQAIDADVRFESDDPVKVVAAPGGRLGGDGWSSFVLPVGRWTVTVEAAGLGAQSRGVLVEPGAIHLLTIDARLARHEGAGILDVAVVRPNGAPVDAARVAIDGTERGSTSNTGTLRVAGIAPGAHVLTIAGDDITPVEQAIEVGADVTRVRVEAPWRPGTTRLRAMTSAGPALDARVLVSGRRFEGPLAVDAQGELQVVLDPGAWSAFASSPAGGEGERTFQAPTTVPPPLLDIAVQPLTPPAPTDPADLLLVVQDTDRAPVAAARVRLGAREGVTGPDGTLVLEGLVVGASPLDVSATGYAAVQPSERLALHPGPQQRTLRLRGLPRPVDVRVDGPAGPLDAAVALDGRYPVLPLRTGATGSVRVPLVPGTWSVAARADDVGADLRAVTIAPGIEPIPVNFRLGVSQVQVEGTQITFDTPIRFAFGLARIAPESDALLREIAAQLVSHPEFAQVVLHGHTDDVGNPEANKLLSLLRAEAVRERLIALGVDVGRLSAEGHGDTQPLVDNATEEGRATNRRVAFEVRSLTPMVPSPAPR